MQIFNVAEQRPFPVKIEDFSSRNDLLPVSNVHLLSVTDLLQREDYCCYKREDQLKKKDIQEIQDPTLCTTRTTIFPSNHKRSQFLVVWRFWEPSSSSARELQVFFSELLTMFNLQRHSSSEALFLFATASESHLREQSSIFLLHCNFSCSLWAPVLYFYSLRFTSFVL